MTISAAAEQRLVTWAAMDAIRPVSPAVKLARLETKLTFWESNLYAALAAASREQADPTRRGIIAQLGMIRSVRDCL